MNNFNNAVILAGGSGVRMRPLTNYIPKGLVMVDDKTLIGGVIDMLNANNIKNKYVTYNHLSSILFNNTKHDVSGYINTVDEDNAYFLFNSFVKYIDEPIITISCDLKIEIDLDEVYKDYKRLGEPALMIIGTNNDEKLDADGVKFNENNEIIDLSRDMESNIFCTGLQIINPHKINVICEEEDNFYNVWKQLFNTKEIKISNIYPTKWASFDYINQVI